MPYKPIEPESSWPVGGNERVVYQVALLLLGAVIWQGLVARFLELSGMCERAPYCVFWNSMDGTVRQAYSMPLQAPYRAVWDRVIAEAHKQGFVFSDPEPRQTTSAFAALTEVGGRIYAVARFSNRVYIDTKYLQRMTEAEQCHLMAHELGHQMDFQTERLGHASLKPLRPLPMQSFADEFSVLICGREALKEFDRRWHHHDTWWDYVF